MCDFIIERQLNIEHIRVVALFVLQKLGLKKMPNVVQTSVVLGIHLWPLSVYGTIFFHRLAVSERVFKYPSSWSEPIKRFKMVAIIRFDLDVSKMTVHSGCCTTVVVQNEIQIHQQKRGKAYLYVQ